MEADVERTNSFRFFPIVPALLALFLLLSTTQAAEPGSKLAVAIEALNRLEGVDLEQNAAVKKAVLNILEKTRGTHDFVQIVKKFQIKDQEAGLVQVVLNNSTNEAGSEAIRLLLRQEKIPLLEQKLASTNLAEVLPVIDALGSSGQKKSALLLVGVAGSHSDKTAQKRAVRALAQSSDGAQALLGLARDGKLPAALQLTAASELNTAPWPEVRKEAGQILPLPSAKNSEPLPPVAELMKRNGDSAKGRLVFQNESIGCLKCHKVRGEGTDVGPDLSEIGSKLGKDALYEAILDPNAGISFGYEAHQVELKSGDELFGLVVTDTADELVIKDLSGVVQRFKKSEVARREVMKQSMMPASLQQGLSTQEFVDLVEYLFSLKKK